MTKEEWKWRSHARHYGLHAANVIAAIGFKGLPLPKTMGELRVNARSRGISVWDAWKEAVIAAAAGGSQPSTKGPLPPQAKAQPAMPSVHVVMDGETLYNLVLRAMNQTYGAGGHGMLAWSTNANTTLGKFYVDMATLFNQHDLALRNGNLTYLISATQYPMTFYNSIWQPNFAKIMNANLPDWAQTSQQDQDAFSLAIKLITAWFGWYGQSNDPDQHDAAAATNVSDVAVGEEWKLNASGIKIKITKIEGSKIHLDIGIELPVGELKANAKKIQ